MKETPKFEFRLDPQPQTAEVGKSEDTPKQKKHSFLTNFSVTPLELEQYLNQYVIGQEEAVSILATKIATHYNRMKMEFTHPDLPPIVGNIKPNIILIGPTGVGKTYIIRLIAEYINVPFVKGDATKFSETGYVGGDVEDLVRDLVYNAGGDIQAAERGIIYIDEIDKIASAQNVVGLDVSRSGVQRNLLKIMEETEVDMKVPHDIASQMEAVMEIQRTGKAERKKVNTRNILFVVSGAFSGLEEIVKKRVRGSTIGFGALTENQMKVEQNWQNFISAQDLIRYGFETEFVGRLPVHVKLRPLTEEDFYKILKSPTSAVILGKKRDFLAYNIDLEFTDDAFREIAKLAVEEGTGARGILSVIEKILLPFEKYLPHRVSKLIVTKEVVLNPQIELEKLLAELDSNEYARKVALEHSIFLKVPSDTLYRIIELSKLQKITVKEWLENNLKNYPYGLRLLGQSELVLTPEIIENPQEYLDRKIKENYSKINKTEGKQNGNG